MPDAEGRGDSLSSQSIGPRPPSEQRLRSDCPEEAFPSYEVTEKEYGRAAYDDTGVLEGIKEDRVEYVRPSGMTKAPIDLKWPAKGYRCTGQQEIGQHVGEDQQETDAEIHPWKKSAEAPDVR
jgi:hypothetical protein